MLVPSTTLPAWADELAFVTDDRGVQIVEFVNFPHDTYERVAGERAAGSLE